VAQNTVNWPSQFRFRLQLSITAVQQELCVDVMCSSCLETYTVTLVIILHLLIALFTICTFV